MRELPEQVEFRVKQVFQELIYRHKLLTQTQRLELFWQLLFSLALAILIALMPLGLIKLTGGVPGIILGLADASLSVLVYQRLKVQRLITKRALVNYRVLRHHLIGMLEVNFCTCHGACGCKEEFISYAKSQFGISLV